MPPGKSTPSPIVPPNRSSLSPVRPLDPAANAQKIWRTEEHVELHREYAISKIQTEYNLTRQMAQIYDK